MRRSRFLRSALCPLLSLVLSAQFAFGQIDWPTREEVLHRGDSLAEQELREILSDRTALLSPGLGASGLGASFRCTGGATSILYFGSQVSGLETGSCRVEDSQFV